MLGDGYSFGSLSLVTQVGDGSMSFGDNTLKPEPLEETVDRAVRAMGALKDENERLRMALTEIEKLCWQEGGGFQKILLKIRKIARHAFCNPPGFDEER